LAAVIVAPPYVSPTIPLGREDVVMVRVGGGEEADSSFTVNSADDPELATVTTPDRALEVVLGATVMANPPLPVPFPFCMLIHFSFALASQLQVLPV
jgi:hypothetical protein